VLLLRLLMLGVGRVFVAAILFRVSRLALHKETVVYDSSTTTLPADLLSKFV
jgi:hypothetical protein